MKLKSTQRKIVEIKDWDELVKTTYGKPYCFQQQDGCQGRGTFPLIVPDPESLDLVVIESQRLTGIGIKLDNDDKVPEFFSAFLPYYE